MTVVRSGPNAMYSRLKGHKRRRIDRARCLARLTDRQLVRRYERYLRQEVMAEEWVEQTGGLRNPVGTRNNVRRWKGAAAKELALRGMDFPTVWEAWAHTPASEFTLRNRDLVALRTGSIEQLQEEIAAVDKRRDTERFSPELGQRHQVLLGLLTDQLHAGASWAVHMKPVAASRLIQVADRIARHLQDKIGWRLRTVEVRHALHLAGVPERPDREDESIPFLEAV